MKCEWLKNESNYFVTLSYTFSVPVFLLPVVNSFLVAGAGVDGLVSTMVLSLVSPTAQIWELWLCLPTGNYYQGSSLILEKWRRNLYMYMIWLCLPTGNYPQGSCPILCKFWWHFSNYTK